MKRFFDSGWGWALCAVGITVSGFMAEWTIFYKILLGLILLSGVFRLLAAYHRKQLRRLRAMTPEQREEFLSQFDEKTRTSWKEQIKQEEP